MKYFIFSALLLLITSEIQAKEKRPMGKLETNIRLNGVSIKGKDLKPMLLDTLSEQDKYLEDLVGLRQDFKDRNEKDKQRRTQ
jgi:hypothetical protein